MTDQGPEIRNLARKGKIRYTRHAVEKMLQYGLNVLQVNEMLKNCNHNQRLGDGNGCRVEGRAPAFDNTGTRMISAHVKVTDLVLVITVINN